MESELFFDVFDPGVAGVREPCRPDPVSDPFLNLLSPNRSPKLFRPVDDEVRVVGGANRSSMDSLPRELKVDERPLRFEGARVGEAWPEFLELGLNKAVAGDMLDFANRPRAEDGVSGTGVSPFRDDVDGREGVGVSFLLNPETREDVLTRTGSGDVVESEVLEAAPSPDSPLIPFCKCPMGKSGSGCFCLRRVNLKKLFVLGIDGTVSSCI